MLDPRLFTPLPPAERRALAEAYLAFVRERDGEPDLPGRTLARREAWFAGLTRTPAPRWDGERIDAAAFRSWHLGERPLRDASPLAVWLVMIARANEGEEWGVDYLLDRGGFQGLGKRGTLQPRDFADLEETYHTRIFREIVRLFGLDFELRPPPRSIQHSVKLMAVLPEALSFTLLAAGELMGTIAFLELAQRAERLLAGHPAILARIRDLLDEILIDEVGHVTYLLGSMGGVRLAVVRETAKAYHRYTRRGYYRGMRDDSVVAFMRHGLENYSLGLFPERVLRRAFVPDPYWPREAA
ncbi:MAG: hypothetical protein ACREQL_14570 [Candidatus Binatia bacterium]